jgi:hypothetical protein
VTSILKWASGVALLTSIAVSFIAGVSRTTTGMEPWGAFATSLLALIAFTLLVLVDRVNEHFKVETQRWLREPAPPPGKR